MSIVDYDHVDPEYADATAHTAEGIALLCPNHHGMRGRGFLSTVAVKAAMADPHCKRHGFSFGEMEGGKDHPVIVFAGQRLEGCVIPIQVENFPLLKVEPPEVEGGPYQLSASFFDENGKPSLLIEKNEWRIMSSQWDATCSGGRIVIHSAPRKQTLGLRILPGEGVEVERVDMRVGKWHFLGSEGKLDMFTRDGRHHSSMTGCLMSGCHIGISLE